MKKISQQIILYLSNTPNFHHLTAFFFFLFQTSRDESRTSASTTSQHHDKNHSKELLEETLRGPLPYPMIVTPPSGAYWTDGYENDSRHQGSNQGPTAPWRSKIECDDTAKCYRRFFLGRVSLSLFLSTSFERKSHQFHLASGIWVVDIRIRV